MLSRKTKQGKRTGRAPLAAASFFLVAFSIPLVAGCRSCERVEAELRARENEVRELKDELHRLEAINDGMMHEQAARANSSAKITPEASAQTFQIKEVVLGRQTSGFDEDNTPGDEGLQVVVEPRDADGHSLKAPGSLEVSVLEIQPQGIKTPLSTWEVPPDQLRRMWKSGLLSTGYYVHLTWKNWPSVNKLRVVARFILADGRVFEADKDVTIRPTKTRKSDLGAPLPTEETPLPEPRRVEPLPQPLPESPKPNEPQLPLPQSLAPQAIEPAPSAPIERVGIWQAAPLPPGR